MDASITFSDSIGNVKLHHTFNGAVPVGRCWMVCNGNVINQTNYDALHGTGAYVRDGIANSPLIGKTLPDMSDKFAVGTTNTTQTGSGTITSVGLSGHTLTVPSHNHKWYTANGTGVADQSFNGAGTGINIATQGKGLGTRLVASGLNTGDTTNGPNADLYTTKENAISTSIKPESIEFLYIICVI